MALFYVVGFGIALPLWAWGVSQLHERSTFGWRYLSGAAPPLLYLAALGLSGGALRAVARVALLALMAVVTLVNVFSGGREDHRRLVEFVVANARPGDLVVAKPPWDKEPLREETTWRYYLDRVEVPEGATIPPDVGYEAWIERASGPEPLPERVWVWFRDPYYQWVRKNLSEHYAQEEIWPMGPDMTLHLFAGIAGKR